MSENNWSIECVIYDCDGVILDSLEANKRLYNHIAASLGREDLTRDEVRFCHAHTVFDSIRHIFRDDEAQAARGIEFLKNDVDFRDFIQYLKLEPHILDILDIIRKKGMKTAISTNRTTSMKYVMDHFGLWPYFDMVVTALDVAKPKPDKESVEKILQTLGLDREKTLYVGDSEVDGQTARSAGVIFVAYKNNSLESDGSIEEHLHLLDYLSGEGRPSRC